MIADSYFAIGRGHRVCQDYARAFSPEAGTYAYACVSDGCSGSEDTDIGARLACLSAMHYWRAGEGSVIAARWLGEFLRWRAAGMWEWLGIGSQALNATLLGVHWAAEQPSPVITMLGDGAVAAAQRDGSSLMVLPHRYAPDAQGRVRPFYPVYETTGSHSGISVLTRHGKAPSVFGRGGEDGDALLPGRPDQASARATGHVEAHGTPDVVAVFSDGVESFKRKDADGRVISVPAWDVIARCMTFKGPLTPGFVARRCASFLERFCPANGWFYTDDFSMAAVAKTGDGG